MSRKKNLNIEFVDRERISEEECESIVEMLMEWFERDLEKREEAGLKRRAP